MTYQHLADAVKRRRDELNLNQSELGSRGGPSITKVGQIERCQAPEPAGATLRKLDTALGWPAGTSLAILRAAEGEEIQQVGTVHLKAGANLAFGSSVTPPSQDDDLRYQRPPGIPDAEWDRIRAEARDYIDYQLSKAAKER